jgi:hypothetical protein
MSNAVVPGLRSCDHASVAVQRSHLDSTMAAGCVVLLMLPMSGWEAARLFR